MKDSTRLVVTTGTANHLIADVWAIRNDFYHDHPDIVSGLVQGIFEGMDMVRKDPARAAQGLAAAFENPGGGLQKNDWQGWWYRRRRCSSYQFPGKR